KWCARTAQAAVRRSPGWAIVLLAAASLAPLPSVTASAAEPDGEAASAGVSAQDVYAPPRSDGQIQAGHAQGQIWLLAGEPRQATVTVQVGDQGVLVVDTGVREMAKALLAQIQRLAQAGSTDQRAIRYVIDTD